VAAAFAADPRGITVRLAGNDLLLPMRRLHRFQPEAAAALAAARAGGEELESLYLRLSTCACLDRAEELEVLAGELAGSGAGSGAGCGPAAQADPPAAQAQRRALWLLRKLAHPKHRRRYEECAALLARLAREGRCEVLARGLEAIRRQAEARFAG
jgi:hypothetical protein